MLVLSPVLVTLGACSSLIYDYGDYRDMPDAVSDADMTLKLNIDTRLMTQSRADKGAPDRYEPSAGDFEQIRTLRVIILRPGEGGNLVVEGNRCINTLPDGSLQPYQEDYLEFKVKGNEMKTIYLIANEASIPAPDGGDCGPWLNTTFALNEKIASADNPLDSWTVAMPATPEGEPTVGLYHDKRGNLLPLTEVFQLEAKIDETDNNEEYHIQESSLFLTHAAAKATFEFDFKNYKDYKGYGGSKVTGIRFSGFDDCQYVFPHDAGYYPSKYVEGKPGTINDVTFADPEKEGRFIKTFSIPETAKENAPYISGSGMAIEMKASSDGTTWGPIYFPESKARAAAAGQYKVSVQLDNGEWLDAQPLVDNILSIDGYDAISRNTHLRVTIKFNENDIDCVVQLVPYVRIDLDPSFGFWEVDPSNK